MHTHRRDKDNLQTILQNEQTYFSLLAKGCIEGQGTSNPPSNLLSNFTISS